MSWYVPQVFTRAKRYPQLCVLHCDISILFMCTFFIYIEMGASLGIHQIYYEHHLVPCVCLAHVAHMTKSQISTILCEMNEDNSVLIYNIRF